MWGCKTFYQDKVFQPRNRPRQGSSGSKGTGALLVSWSHSEGANGSF